MTARQPSASDRSTAPLAGEAGWASLLGMGLAAPTRCDQQTVGDWLRTHMGALGVDFSITESILQRSPIKGRRIAQFDRSLVEKPPAPGSDWRIANALAVFREASRKLAARSARDALSSAGIAPEQVTHIVAVSSTGGSIPGTDVDLIVDAELPRTIPRKLLSGMGCSGAFYGLETARTIATADPSALVLVTCVEVCSAHPQADGLQHGSVADSLFGDAAASVIVGARREPGCSIADFGPQHSLVDPTRAALIRWDLDDDGFKIVLSPRLPVAIGQIIGEFVQPLVDAIAATGLPADVRSWALHPGGTAILRQIERKLSLRPEALESAMSLLLDNGNLSSPSVLFTLAEETRRQQAGTDGIMLGFGPGLALEAARYRVGEAPASAIPA